MKKVVDKFNKLKVLVIGDAILDRYIKGGVKRVCREAPVGVVETIKATLACGGAANTAAGAADLGAKTYLVGIIGKDDNGKKLKRLLRGKGVGLGGVLTSGKTLTKNRVFADKQMMLRFDQGKTEYINDKQRRQVKKNIERLYKRTDVVIISDYNYGAIDGKIRRFIKKLAEKENKILVIDAKDLRPYLQFASSMIKPNFEEALRAAGRVKGGTRRETAKEAGKKLLKISRTRIVAITLDRDGVMIFRPGKSVWETKTRPINNQNAIGAGDIYSTTFGMALAAGSLPKTAAKIAMKACSVVLSREGTTTCSQKELRGVLRQQKKIIKSRWELTKLVARFKREKQRVVFTNGCFDIIHAGHVAMLERAKKMGDKLIVAVNTDDSVRRLKGEGRPINPLPDRMKVLAGLKSVDKVISFGENTPINLIKIVRPEIFVKGGDYTKEGLPETQIVEELGGEVRIISLVRGRSTTGIIRKIRNEGEEIVRPVARYFWDLGYVKR